MRVYFPILLLFQMQGNEWNNQILCHFLEDAPNYPPSKLLSPTFPNLPIFEAIPYFVEQSQTLGRSPTLRAFRQWVREKIEI